MKKVFIIDADDINNEWQMQREVEMLQDYLNDLVENPNNKLLMVTVEDIDDIIGTTV